MIALHHRGSKLEPRSDLRSTQKTVAPFEFIQSWTGDRDEVHFEPPKLAVRNLDPRSAAIVDKCTKFVSYLISTSHFGTMIDESEIQNHEISLVQHFYIGTKIKLDSGSELGSMKMLVQPGLRPCVNWARERSLVLSRPRHYDVRENALLSSQFVGEIAKDREREDTLLGATVAEWLYCSPPPTGSLRIFTSGDRAGRCRWSAGFLGSLPFYRPFVPALLHSHLISPSSALKASLLRAAQISEFNSTDTRPRVYCLAGGALGRQRRLQVQVAEARIIFSMCDSDVLRGSPDFEGYLLVVVTSSAAPHELLGLGRGRGRCDLDPQHFPAGDVVKETRGGVRFPSALRCGKGSPHPPLFFPTPWRCTGSAIFVPSGSRRLIASSWPLSRYSPAPVYKHSRPVDRRKWQPPQGCAPAPALVNTGTGRSRRVYGAASECKGAGENGRSLRTPADLSRKSGDPSGDCTRFALAGGELANRSSHRGPGGKGLAWYFPPRRGTEMLAGPHMPCGLRYLGRQRGRDVIFPGKPLSVRKTDEQLSARGGGGIPRGARRPPLPSNENFRVPCHARARYGASPASWTFDAVVSLQQISGATWRRKLRVELALFVPVARSQREYGEWEYFPYFVFTDLTPFFVIADCLSRLYLRKQRNTASLGIRTWNLLPENSSVVASAMDVSNEPKHTSGYLFCCTSRQLLHTTSLDTGVSEEIWAALNSEVNMEQRRNGGAGETGDPRENPPTSGVVRHDSHMRKSGSGPVGRLSPCARMASEAVGDERYCQPAQSSQVDGSVISSSAVDSQLGTIPRPQKDKLGFRVLAKLNLTVRVVTRDRGALLNLVLTTDREISETHLTGIPNTSRAAINSATRSLQAEATVAERLARSPPTMTNRAQSPAVSPHFRNWESCRTMPLVDGFSRDLPFPPTPSFRRRFILT
ncbi:hypothetical protein PR048_028880 [Dryococelus australis]|uniref:Uncharacterized protein n=1 Tax=Dryococelus australis TaxID=614101 RepID=A0ABQ9GBU4_9NEOP|nr:hypothetical protein PR048_028880 [Dryococelus australis]